MKKIVFALATIFTMLLISCKEEGKKENAEPTQMQEVMAIHDEVMPKMGRINTLIQELNTKIDTTEVSASYAEAKKDLEAAHKFMMDWMKGFGDRFTSDEIMKGKSLSDEKKKWLDEEEEKVNELRNQINSSIENAEELLNK